MKLSKLSRIEFIVTYHCTGQCLHCSLGEQLNRPAHHKHVKSDAAVQTVAWLADHFPITSVMTFGGEPLLHSDVVCAVHSTAVQHGIGTRQLITNGFFTRDEEKIQHTATKLKRAGVNNLLLSVDAFHQQTIPLEIVRSFAKAVKAQDIAKFRLQPAWVVNAEHDNPFNTKTRQILESFRDLDIPVGSGNDIFLAGNAAKNLSSYYDVPKLDLSQTCGSMPYTAPPAESDTLSVEPNGDVSICAFVIGNIYQDSIEEIVTRFDPDRHEGIRAVMDGGVPALIKLAQRKGIEVDCTDCYTACDVCRKINR